MARLGANTLVAGQDVKAGESTTMYALFSFSERAKEFMLGEDVKRGETRVTAVVDKVGTIEAVSNVSKKRGERCRMPMLIPYDELNTPIAVQQDIKKGDSLEAEYRAVS